MVQKVTNSEALRVERVIGCDPPLAIPAGAAVALVYVPESARQGIDFDPSASSEDLLFSVSEEDSFPLGD